MMDERQVAGLLNDVDAFLGIIEPCLNTSVCFAADTSVRWWDRPLSAAEKRVNFVAIERNLGGVIEEYRERLNAEWVRMIRQVRGEVSEWVGRASLRPAQKLLGIQRLHLGTEAFQGLLVQVGVDSYPIGTRSASEELGEAGAQVARFDASTPVSPPDLYGLGDFQALLESKSFRIATGMEHKVLQTIARRMENAYANGYTGGTLQEILDQVFQDLEEGHLISPGRTDGYDYRSEAVQETTVRTIANDAFNGARQDLYQKHPDFVLGYSISEVAEGKDFSRNGKLRSHPLSQHLDGKKIRYRLEDGRPNPYARQFAGANHYNAREVDVPETALDEPIEWSSQDDLETALNWKQKLSPDFV